MVESFNGGNFFLYLLIFFTSFVFTVFFTPLLIRYLTNNGVVDVPDERRVHVNTTPRMGGLIIFTVVLVQIFSFYGDLNSIRLIVLGTIIVAAIGIIDDIHTLTWYTKFAGQFILGLLVVIHLSDYASEVELLGVVLPGYLGYIVAFFFVVGAINSINLMDGMDGLVSGYSISFMFVIFSLSLYFNDYTVTFIAITLIGSLLAFSKYNSYPAKIFLGDTGSLVLGYLLVVTSLLCGLRIEKQTLNLTLPLLLLAVPIIDTLKVMTFRMIRKGNPFLPDKTHLHHIILESKVKHKSTVFIIHILSMFFYLLALLYIFSDLKSYVLITFFLLAGLVMLIKPILNFFSKAAFINRFFYDQMFLPYKVIESNKSILMLVSFIALVVSVVSIFPRSINLEFNTLLLIVITEIFLLIAAFFQVKENLLQNHFYVFINMTVFFILFQTGTHYQDGAFLLNGTSLVFKISFSIVTLFVVSILFVRVRVFSRENIFLSGLDLIIISMIFLAFIVQNFIQSSYLLLLSPSMIMAFIVYLWYRIFVELKGSYKKMLFYSTFFVPIAAIFLSL